MMFRTDYFTRPDVSLSQILPVPLGELAVALTTFDSVLGVLPFLFACEDAHTVTSAHLMNYMQYTPFPHMVPHAAGVGVCAPCS